MVEILKKKEKEIESDVAEKAYDFMRQFINPFPKEFLLIRYDGNEIFMVCETEKNKFISKYFTS
jgi:hypothetical protein